MPNDSQTKTPNQSTSALEVLPPEDLSLDEAGVREKEPKEIRPVVALTTLRIYAVVVVVGIGVATYLAYIFDKPELFMQVFTAVFSSLATIAGTIIAHYFRGK